MIRTYKSLKWPGTEDVNEAEKLTKIVCGVWNCKKFLGIAHNQIN